MLKKSHKCPFFLIVFSVFVLILHIEKTVFMWLE